MPSEGAEEVRLGHITYESTELQVRLKLPEMWEEVEVDRDGFHDWLAGRLGSMSLTASERAQVEARLGSSIVEARSRGLMMSAAFAADVVGADDGLPNLVSASMFVAQKVVGESDEILSVTAILMALAASEAAGDIKALVKPLPLVLANHDAVRLLTVEEFPEDRRGPYSATAVLSYFFILNEHRTLMTVGFATPCFWLIDDLVQLFDEIAATIEISYQPLAVIAEPEC